MALSFGQGSAGLFPTSNASGQGLRTKTELQLRQEQQDTIPDIAPGEVILWERGDGQGEFFTSDNSLDSVGNATSFRGQTFKIGSTTPDGDFALNTITLKLFRIDTPGTITLEVFEVDGDEFPTGSAISTATTNGDTLTTNQAGELRTFTMSSVNLKANTTYALVLDARNKDVLPENLGFRINTNSASYPDGKRIRSNDSGGTWANGAAGDLYFDIQGGGKFLITRTIDNDLYQTTLKKVT